MDYCMYYMYTFLHICFLIHLYLYTFLVGMAGGIHGTTNQKNQGCYSAKTKIGAKKYYINRCKSRAN